MSNHQPQSINLLPQSIASSRPAPPQSELLATLIHCIENERDSEAFESNLVEYLRSNYFTNIVHWLYNVVDSLNLSREVVAIAAYYLNTFSCEYFSPSITNDGVVETRKFSMDDFQLMACSSLRLAVKISSPANKISVHAIKQLTNDRFTVHDILNCEVEIVKLLAVHNWDIEPVTIRLLIWRTLLVVNDIGAKKTDSNPVSCGSCSEQVRKEIFEVLYYFACRQAEECVSGKYR